MDLNQDFPIKSGTLNHSSSVFFILLLIGLSSLHSIKMEIGAHIRDKGFKIKILLLILLYSIK